MPGRQCRGSIAKNHTMNTAKKRLKNKDIIKENDENEQIESALLPGLPNHLAHLCLSSLQPSLLYNVNTSWRKFIYSPYYPPFFSLYALLYKTSSISPSVGFFCFDTISSKWKPLPSPPSNPPLCLIRHHPSYISRVIPIQSVTTSGHLVLVAGTTNKFLPALTRPLVFDPLSSKWYFGPPLLNPRRWCVTGSINGAIYVASGVGTKYQCDVAKSLERWDISKHESSWNWEKRASFRDGRFSREAVEAVGYRGKLCMVNIKGKTLKEGAVYNVVMDQWEEMPRGMLAGWNGPATVDDDDDVMYVVDQENGSMRKYNADNDRWEEMIEASEYLKGAEHISAGRGRVCAVSGDGRTIVVVDILSRPVKTWRVNPPQGMEAIAVHILPRMVTV
ncbi:hypothetical protein BUALT_Bualt19G0032000 [Buddleja alternifolia]|uniref:F-box/kelch-repeat protein SKIP25 n=1 Tax=Buddleja alternifolia TaxID=168488 RepID=A0AAV6W4P9_9LAMI|nr:hypothetical protein BUALT_Bualt19G0032000 [Buddleja alternifolia]